ncbi:MAG: hypothetical protein ACREDR_20665 [Blastocatellia bacterium]
MSGSTVIEEQDLPHELARVFEQARRNLFWFSENAKRLGVYERHRGRYLAAAGEELFIADTADEVRRLAEKKHPGEMPHVRYIPRENRSRIYAN